MAITLTQEPSITDWDDAYANAAHIPNGNDFPEQWAKQAQDFRSAMQNLQRAELGVQYGTHPRQFFDVFMPEGEPLGLAVVVHGGFWLKCSCRDFSHLAKGACDNGYITVMINYPLCPEASFEELTSSVATAINQTAALHATGPVHLAGHSAGGQLVTRLLCEGTGLDTAVQTRINRVLSISGVHDLLPLRRTQMNEHLKLSEALALSHSPARLQPQAGKAVCAWVGGNERPEFIRQNHLLSSMWYGQGIHVAHCIEADKHHFDVIDGLCEATSPMLQWWLGLNN